MNMDVEESKVRISRIVIQHEVPACWTNLVRVKVKIELGIGLGLRLLGLS